MILRFGGNLRKSGENVNHLGTKLRGRRFSVSLAESSTPSRALVRSLNPGDRGTTKTRGEAMAKEFVIEGTQTTLFQGEEKVGMTMEQFQSDMQARLREALDQPVDKIVPDDTFDPLDVQRDLSKSDVELESQFAQETMGGLQEAWAKARAAQEGKR